MKKLIFCIIFCLILTVPVHGSVVGDGYGTIGGGETPPPPSIPAEQPVITQPEPEQPSVPETPPQKTEKKETPKIENKEIEKIEEKKTTQEPKKEETTVSENVVPEVKNEIKTEPNDDQAEPEPERKEENKEQERIDVVVLSLSGNAVVDNDPSFDITPTLDVLKIILTVIVSYLVVLLGYAFMFMPRLYLYVDDKYRFAAFLILRRSENGYRIRIPRYIVKNGDSHKEGKIIFVRSKNMGGQSLDIQIDKESITYPIDHEVSIYISREEG